MCKIRERNINLDLIRSVALLCVISIHYLSYTGYYSGMQTTWGGYCFSLLRVMFITCVPLFLMLSGYLCCKKQLTSKYYLGIIRVLLTYIIAGILCQIFELVINGGRTKEILLSFFEFKAAPYGWYIGMYVGLFLVIPFINKLWCSLDLKRKKALLVSCIVLTALPCLTNSFDFTKDSFWQSTKDSHTQLLPEYFISLYPVTYYIIGCYIKEKEEYIINLSKKKVSLFLIVSIIGFGTINFFKNYGIEFPWSLDTAYGSYQSCIVATLIFLLLLRIRIYPGYKVNALTILSKHSLAIYLLSYITDKLYYHFFCVYAKTDFIKILGCLPTVMIITVATLVMSIPIDYMVEKISAYMKRGFLKA